MKVPSLPGSGKDIAEGKGVAGDCKSEGRWMEGKKCVVPREVCTECFERSKRYCEITLNVQKSAEAIVAFFSVKDRINRSL